MVNHHWAILVYILCSCKENVRCAYSHTQIHIDGQITDFLLKLLRKKCSIPPHALFANMTLIADELSEDKVVC